MTPTPAPAGSGTCPTASTVVCSDFVLVEMNGVPQACVRPVPVVNDVDEAYGYDNSKATKVDALLHDYANLRFIHDTTQDEVRLGARRPFFRPRRRVRRAHWRGGVWSFRQCRRLIGRRRRSWSCLAVLRSPLLTRPVPAGVGRTPPALDGLLFFLLVFFFCVLFGCSPADASSSWPSV